MNVSLSAHSTTMAPGAAAKSGASDNPLADFMALLGELGIAVDGDGTVAAPGPENAAGTGNIAAKLLAKLGKKAGDTALPDTETAPVESKSGKDSKDSNAAEDDPVAALAALLNGLDPGASRPLDKLDVAGLLHAVKAAVADADAKPAVDGTAPVTQAAKSAPNIASLLARGRGSPLPASVETMPESPASSEPATLAPGTLQSVFARLENLVAHEARNAEVPVETGAPVKDRSGKQHAIDGTANESGKQATNGDAAGVGPKADVGAAKLNELLARLTASTKPGTAEGQPQLPKTGAAPVTKAPSDPQLAVLAQVIQASLRDDRVNENTGDQTAATAAFSVGSVSLSSVSVASSNASQTGPAEEMMRHHLDLARDSEWLDTLARDIARAAQTDTQLRFQLNPEHLGSLKVEVLNGSNGTSVKLTADTEAARAILTDAQPRLIAEAKAQGLRISEAHVDLSGQGGGQRHMADTPVVIRTGSAAAAVAEVEQDMPAGSGERYA